MGAQLTLWKSSVDRPFCEHCMETAVKAALTSRGMSVGSPYRQRWAEYAAETFLLAFDHGSQGCANPVRL